MEERREDQIGTKLKRKMVFILVIEYTSDDYDDDDEDNRLEESAPHNK